MGARNYQDLIVWQRAMIPAQDIYQVTKSFPSDERFGLTQQMRRAAVSIPSNIAEGQGRQTTKEFIHFLYIAHGSTREIETQILLCERLGYINPEHQEQLLSTTSEVGRLGMALINSLKRKQQD